MTIHHASAPPSEGPPDARWCRACDGLGFDTIVGDDCLRCHGTGWQPASGGLLEWCRVAAGTAFVIACVIGWLGLTP